MNRTILLLALLAVACGGPSRSSAGLAAPAASLAADGAAEPSGDDGAEGRVQIQSGTLTAGSFDDNAEIEVYRKFAKSLGQDPAYGPFSAGLVGRRIVVTVNDSWFCPVANATVRVAAGTRVLVEISRKFRVDQLSLRLAQHGLKSRQVYTDDRRWFALLLLQRV